VDSKRRMDKDGWASLVLILTVPCSYNYLQRRCIDGNHYVGFVQAWEDRPDTGYMLHKIWVCYWVSPRLSKNTYLLSS
jgi:hypothetical protein